VSPRRRRPPLLDLINGILWSCAGETFTSMHSELSAIAEIQDSLSKAQREIQKRK